MNSSASSIAASPCRLLLRLLFLLLTTAETSSPHRHKGCRRSSCGHLHGIRLNAVTRSWNSCVKEKIRCCITRRQVLTTSPRSHTRVRNSGSSMPVLFRSINYRNSSIFLYPVIHHERSEAQSANWSSLQNCTQEI